MRAATSTSGSVAHISKLPLPMKSSAMNVLNSSYVLLTHEEIECIMKDLNKQIGCLTYLKPCLDRKNTVVSDRDPREREH